MAEIGQLVKIWICGNFFDNCQTRKKKNNGGTKIKQLIGDLKVYLIKQHIL
jgi:hypothetical protein